jgi:hypothetical protein
MEDASFTLHCSGNDGEVHERDDHENNRPLIIINLIDEITWDNKFRKYEKQITIEKQLVKLVVVLQSKTTEGTRLINILSDALGKQETKSSSVATKSDVGKIKTQIKCLMAADINEQTGTCMAL